MANSNILTYALVGGAAYFAYSWWKSQPTVVTTTGGGTSGGSGGSGGGSSSGGGTPPATITTPPAPDASKATTAQAASGFRLAGAASSTGPFNADQWNYYWNQLGFTPNNNFDQTFFPNGRPSDPSKYTLYTPIQFVVAADAGGTGMAGLGGYLPRPVFVGRGFGGYGMADFRSAGRRY